MRPRVFVVRDHTMNPLLDRLSDMLRAQGVDVTRGPENEPGTIRELSSSLRREPFDSIDVAVLSSRWACSRTTLEAGSRLRGVVAATIGAETIDIRTADELGIIVGNGGAAEHIISMAEASVMLMMNLRYALAYSEEVMRGRHPRPAVDAVKASLLYGSTVGIVGLGRIGMAVAERLAALGVRLLAYSPKADRAKIPAHVSMVSLEELMSRSDIVGVFVAVRPDNRRLISAEMIALMKPTAYLVNVARGTAIDEPALVDALRAHRIAGAALDTFEVEPLPAQSPLRTLDNVILTPHMVGHTRESVASIPKMACANVMAILAGQLPVSCKNAHIEDTWRKRLAVLAAA